MKAAGQLGVRFLLQVRFSTLTDYFTALRERAGSAARQPTVGRTIPRGYPVLSGDFFTYADRDDHYWSGYFTSRPFYKALDRIVEGYQRYYVHVVSVIVIINMYV